MLIDDRSSTLVFVFGTLKEGFPNFSTNSGKRSAGDFATVERYPLYLVGERFSPWLIDATGQGERIVGQVFVVDDATLSAMDELERVTEPDGYRRKCLLVEALHTETPEAIEVHAYLKQPHQLAAGEIRLGPLREYLPEHAALYRSRRSD